MRCAAPRRQPTPPAACNHRRGGSSPMLSGRPAPAARPFITYSSRRRILEGMVVDTIVRLVTGLIWLETLLILASVILSWLPLISPWHPAMRVLHALADPVLRPFRRLLPP